MEMGMCQRLYQQQRQVLSQSQKFALKQLLELRLELRHPDLPSVIRGLEGIRVAHQILQKRDSIGILIGGLSEAVWNQRRKPEDLEKHKDVDVAVLDKNFKLEERF